jgi:sulfur relay (sulfurtransferase) complex TusBCD TusD component (DsrE family)
MFKMALASFVVLLALAFTPAFAQQAAFGQPEMVVHLTKFTNGIHEAFMATELADHLQQSGAKVTLFLDVEGVRAADMNQPNNLHFGLDNTTYADIYNQFIKDGGVVIVCPGCAADAGVTKLRPGAHFANPASKEVPKLLMRAKNVIDY